MKTWWVVLRGDKPTAPRPSRSESFIPEAKASTALTSPDRIMVTRPAPEGQNLKAARRKGSQGSPGGLGPTATQASGLYPLTSRVLSEGKGRTFRTA